MNPKGYHVYYKHGIPSGWTENAHLHQLSYRLLVHCFLYIHGKKRVLMQAAELKIHVVKEIAELSDEQFIQVYDDLIRLLHPAVRTPRFGSAKGLVTFMANDFDAPLDDFKDYMP